MLTDGTRNVINSMRANGVRRIAVVTSIGAGTLSSPLPILPLTPSFFPLPAPSSCGPRLELGNAPLHLLKYEVQSCVMV